MANNLNDKGINEAIKRVGNQPTKKDKKEPKQESQALQNIRKVFSIMGGKKKG